MTVIDRALSLCRAAAEHLAQVTAPVESLDVAADRRRSGAHHRVAGFLAILVMDRGLDPGDEQPTERSVAVCGRILDDVVSELASLAGADASWRAEPVVEGTEPAVVQSLLRSVGDGTA
jgi:hypothetical protein